MISLRPPARASGFAARVGPLGVWLCSLFCCASMATRVDAQRSANAAPRSTTVRGTVFDSLRNAPLVGAVVEVAGSFRTAISDKRGEFTLDSVPEGPQRLTFSAPALDSLGLFGFAHDVVVAPGLAPIALATPSLHTFHTRLCAASITTLADSAIVFGTVYDARTKAPVKQGASVIFRWYAMAIGGNALAIAEPNRIATTDDAGNYGMCGLPSDLALRAYASVVSSASGDVSFLVGAPRVVRRDFYISEDFADGDTLRRGSGILVGKVLDEHGKAMVGAQVLLTMTGHTTRTDDKGVWRLVGVPLGTQELSVRQLGRGALFRSVDVTAGETTVDSFVLPTATVLSAVNIRGLSMPGIDRFGYMARKRSGVGQYLDSTQIAQRSDMAAVLTQLSGLRVTRSGFGMELSGRASCRTPLIMIDGTPVMRSPGRGAPDGDNATDRLSTLQPRDVLAVEYYGPGNDGAVGGRTIGGGRCGVLMVWTRLSRWD